MFSSGLGGLLDVVDGHLTVCRMVAWGDGVRSGDSRVDEFWVEGALLGFSGGWDGDAGCGRLDRWSGRVGGSGSRFGAGESSSGGRTGPLLGRSAGVGVELGGDLRWDSGHGMRR